MSQTLKIDEINNILRHYFEVMNLPAEEIEQRILLAEKISKAHFDTFAFIRTMLAVGKPDREFVFTRLLNGYKRAMDVEQFDDEIEELVFLLLDSEIETSFKGTDLSIVRAIQIGENDANAIMNCVKQKEMSAQGYTRKRWDTLKDNRVRHTHIIADGQEVGIDEPFEVGTSKMLYPMDSSLGADAKEIIGCRCVCNYIR